MADKKPDQYPHERYSDEWDAAAGRLAISFSPGVKPCRDCGAPVVRGYCCTYCGSEEP